MTKHRSHAAKKTVANHEQNHTATKQSSQVLQMPPKETPPEQQRPDEPFLAWPFSLFENMMNPWRNVANAVTWKDSWKVGSRLTVPKSESFENAKEYGYTVELPGTERDQITLNFHNGSIMMRVEEKKKRKKNHHSHFIHRAFSLPVYTDASAITAQFKDHVLTIHIPKTDKPVAPTARSISIA